MRSSLLVVLAVACGPKHAPPEPAAPDAPTATPSADAPSAKAATVEVAWFESDGGRCAWMRGGPGRPPGLIATFPGACPTSLSFAVRDGRALVQLDHAWLVTLRTGEATDLGVPPVGDLAELGFDAEGLPLAFSLGGGTYADPERFAGPITFEGRQWATDHVLDGLPVLAHAFEWRDGWRRVETKVVSSGWDYAEDQRGLAAHARVASIASADLWREHVGDAERVEIDGDALSAVLPPEEPDGGEWHAVRTPSGRLAWWMIHVEWLIPTQAVLREAEGGWVPVPFEGWERYEAPSFQTRGGAVLITHWGARPFVLDVASGDVAWRRPAAIAATLWPPPAPPPDGRAP